MADHSSQIALFHLPPYSPEYNPDEYLNHDLKQSMGSREQVKDVVELQTQADDVMSVLSESDAHIKSYFRHPKLDAYADSNE